MLACWAFDTRKAGTCAITQPFNASAFCKSAAYCQLSRYLTPAKHYLNLAFTACLCNHCC